MFGFLRKLFGGSKHERDLKTIYPIVDEINKIYPTLSSLTDEQLRNKSVEFRKRIADHLSELDAEVASLETKISETANIGRKQKYFEKIDELKKERYTEIKEVLGDILPEAYAVVKEAARRFTENETITVPATDFDRELAGRYAVEFGENSPISIEGDNVVWKKRWQAAGAEVEWNMVHYDVQLIGGIVLHEGKIAEMATGEGKTLVATLPAYLNGLTGEGVHIITVNNYLARRDAEWMAPLLNFLFVTVDCIDKYKPSSDGRKRAYKSDVIYGTNSEFGFDYLRDNMARSADDVVQGNYYYAMIDEVDSVLIDDARTPLIISGPVGKDNRAELFQSLKPIVFQLVSEQRKLIGSLLRDAKKKIAEGDTGVTEDGGGLSLFQVHRGLPKNRALIKYLGEQGVQTILRNTENHYMQENSKNMHVADKPLFFVIEEKNRSVELTDKGAEYLGKLTGQKDLFVMEDMSAILADIENNKELSTEDKVRMKDEALQRFKNKNERLHALQQMLKAYTLFEKEEEYVVMDNQVKIVDEQTGRIMDGRRYSDGLHQAIEAKEGVKIEGSTQTYATVTLQNFFRMYAKLAGMTGTAETEAQELWDIYKLDVVVIPTNRPIARDDRQDLVYKTDKEKYNAIIEEVSRVTQAGQPVLVGTTSVQQSELLSRLLKMRGIEHNVLNAKQHASEAEIVAQAGKKGQVTIATNMAGRGTDIKISDEVKAVGGLCIIGTERHESRRVDRQLRGRAGRQGDVGSSQFYVSLEDKLMRLFGSERISKWMDRLGHQEGDVLQHSMITKSIERAQKKVEENNYGVRKRLLEYDDVMNVQREAIYKKRNDALYGERLGVELDEMFYALCDDIASQYAGSQNHTEFVEDMVRYFGMEVEITAEELLNAKANDLTEKLYKITTEAYENKFKQIGQLLMPVIQQVYNDPNAKFTRIAIPFSNGTQGLEIAADLKEAIESEGGSIRGEIERNVSLALIDFAWKEHLRDMDELKDKVQGATFEQKDPIVLYKIEAYALFEKLMQRIRQDIASLLFKGNVVMRRQEEPTEEQKRRIEEERRLRAQIAEQKRQEEMQRQAATQNQQGEEGNVVTKTKTVRRKKRVGRNDPCPCGSGKKYKNCHG